MKVSIFDESVPIPEKEVTLRLIKQCSTIGERKEEVAVMIVDGKGAPIHRGILIAFGPDMRLIRKFNVNDGLGFSLDQCGRLEIKE